MSVVCSYDTVVIRAEHSGRYGIILLMNRYNANMPSNITIVSLTVSPLFHR